MTADEGARVRVLLFETSTHVLWAEEVAREEGIPVEVIPAPEGAHNHCGLAVRALARDFSRLVELMAEEGIPCQEHEG